MERRGFLKGLIGGITSTGLFIAAKPDDVAALALPHESPILLAPEPMVQPSIERGQELFNARGELVAVVTGVSLTSDRIETTTFGHTNRQYMPRPARVDLRVECLGYVEASVDRAASGGLEVEVRGHDGGHVPRERKRRGWDARPRGRSARR